MGNVGFDKEEDYVKLCFKLSIMSLIEFQVLWIYQNFVVSCESLAYKMFWFMAASLKTISYKLLRK